MIQPTQFIWSDGRLIPWQQATVHVMAHGLHYGSSVFEGIRAYATDRGPTAFRLSDHLKRFERSARIYRMDLAYDLDALTAACREVVLQNGLRSAYIRPIAYRGLGDLSLSSGASPISIAIAAIEWNSYLGEEALEQGIDACVSSWQRVGPNTMPTSAKAGGNYLSSQLIGMEARRLGFGEGIALDHMNMVCEGSAENIFLVQDDAIYTPPLWSSILPGLTRDTVIRLARDLGYTVHEQPIPREMLYTADEVFFTGTAAEISPVRSIDEIPIGEAKRGPITHALQRAFFGLFDGTTEDRWGWLEPLDLAATLRAAG